MRKIKLLVLAVLLISVFSIGANAQSNEGSKETINIGNTILKPMLPSNTVRSISFISDNVSELNSSLSISSKTYANENCDNLKLSIYVQKKVNNSWTTLDTYTYTEYNTSSISKSFTYYNVSSGSTYRTKAYHYSTVNGSTTTEINYSSEITVH